MVMWPSHTSQAPRHHVTAHCNFGLVHCFFVSHTQAEETIIKAVLILRVGLSVVYLVEALHYKF
jgi:hypothetical protein